MTAGTPRWAAVVVNYEAGDLLADCVASLRADASAGNPEIVVVDNGSRDGSVAALRATLPDVRVVVPHANVGYAAAANLGIAATTAGVVAVCNPDLVVEAGCAAAMLDRLDAEPDVGAVGPVVRNPDGSPYPSARSVPSLPDAFGHAVLGVWWPSNPFTRRYRQLDTDATRARDVDWVSGAAVWLRRSAVDSVGGWDERFFMYLEDVDLCRRLRRLGWRVVYEPRGAVTHLQGASTDIRPYRMIVEHHRSTVRYANVSWEGPRRLFLAPLAILLTGRCALAVGGRALRSTRRRGAATRPGRPRVTG